MRRIHLKIDIGGTVGAAAWSAITPFSEEDASLFGPQQGSSGPCLHKTSEPHAGGEWWGAVVMVNNNFLAEYVLPHYLDQPRVLDAFIEPEEGGPDQSGA